GTASGNNFSDSPSISADGRMVAFRSFATDLIAGLVDNNNDTDVFVRDRTANTTQLVSVNRSGNATGNRGSDTPLVSADGSTVAFLSRASDLVAGVIDNNSPTFSDLFVRNLAAHTTAVLSVKNSTTMSGDGVSIIAPSVSADGRYEVFASGAPDLVTNDINGTQ